MGIWIFYWFSDCGAVITKNTVLCFTHADDLFVFSESDQQLQIMVLTIISGMNQFVDEC